MKDKAAPDRLTTHSHRLVSLISCLIIIIVALRRRYDLSGGFSIGYALSLLGLFAVLYATESLLSKKVKVYYRFYFGIQMIIVQLL